MNNGAAFMAAPRSPETAAKRRKGCGFRFDKLGFSVVKQTLSYLGSYL